MADKPWLKKHYTLIVVPHAEARFRKVKLPYWLMMFGASVSAILITFLIGFVIHYLMLINEAGRIDFLAKENQRLGKENARYEQLTDMISQKLDTIEEKTKMLSTMAGVKPLETRGIGDISGFENRFNNDILDRDLPLSNLKINDIGATLSKVEKVFNENQEMLDYTPSVWPLISTEYGHITCGRQWRIDPFSNERTFHKGIDISAERGTQVIAPANGVVTLAQSQSGYGNLIVIDHGRNFKSIYGHLASFNVRVGDRIKRGDIIGFVGSTGKSTAPHLHYEVHFNGKDVNPKDYILNYSKGIPSWDYSVMYK